MSNTGIPEIEQRARVIPIDDAPMAERMFSAAELQPHTFPPIRWIVPDVLPEGLTLLAGKPKLGKSWMALDAGLAVAGGGSVLGRQCEAGAVLYLALEDNPRRLQRRLNRIEPHLSWPDSLEFRTQFPALDAGGIDDIRRWLDARENPRLVIVDTLATVRPQAKASDSAYSSDYGALRGLHRIAAEHGIAVVVVHHLRKADAEDPFDAVSGSTGLTGAADATLILTRRDVDGGVILYGRGRDLEEFERGLEFDAVTCRWRDLGDPVEAFAGDTRAAIFAAIRDDKQTPSDIAAHAELDHETVKKALQRMARSGDLNRRARGIYEIPQDPLSTPSPASLVPEQAQKRGQRDVRDG